MRKSIAFIVLFVSIFLISCTEFDVSEISDEDMQRISRHAVVCDPPYIRHGTGCCLDTTGTGICDKDEMPEKEIADDEDLKDTEKVDEPFEVGENLRDRNVTALDVVSVIAHNNIYSQKIYGITILVRVRMNSQPYDLTTMRLIFTGASGSFTAMLQHKDNEDLNFTIETINNITAKTIIDVDEDRIPDNVILVSHDANERLKFFFTRASETAYADLPVNISGASPATPVTLNFTDIPIIGETGKWYGFVHIDGTAESHTSIGSTADIKITRYPVKDFCSFDMLIPETAFCYDVQSGLGNTEISEGEVYRLYYKFNTENYLTKNEEFQIKFVPEEGSKTSIIGTTPSSFNSDSFEIWPSTIGNEEKTYSCSDVSVDVVQVNRIPRICYNEDTRSLEITLQNRGDVDLLGLRLNMLGTEGAMTYDSNDMFEIGRIRKFEIEYDKLKYGEIEFVQVVASIESNDGILECSNKNMQWNNIPLC